MTDIHSILLISKDSKIESFVVSLLNQNFDNVAVAKNANEGKRKLMECPVDIIIVDSGEGEETDTAIDLSDSSSTVILLVPSSNYD
jgi:two-component system, response regulator PdtaR